jgi:hypothetical protein
MSDSQPFAAHGDPTEDGRCRWCGRKLKHRRIIASDADKDNPTYKVEGHHFATIQDALPGGYGDGHFCGLRCGYQFGVRLADLGRRLEVKR